MRTPMLPNARATGLWKMLFLAVQLYTSVLGAELANSSPRLRGNARRLMMAEDSMFSELTLFDTSSGQPIKTLNNNDVINLKSIRSTQLTVLAEPRDIDSVSYVKFFYDGDVEHVEAITPYTMGGDSGGDSVPVEWLTTPGDKTIALEMGMNDGEEAHTETVTFTVAENDDEITPPSIDVPINTPPVSVLEPTTLAPIPVPTTPAPVPFVTPLTDEAVLTGELRKWHKITLAFSGPSVSETSYPNPFTDYRLDVTFSNGPSGEKLVVPGYFAADGDAANTSAEAGSTWQCHFIAPSNGRWTWEARFLTGANVALQWPDDVKGSPTSFHGSSGTFMIGDTNKTGRDLRGKGLLEYVGQHHLQFAETGEWFLKAGSDSPENFLAYDDIDNTGIREWSLKSWEPHQRDYRSGDPTWGDGKGSEIMGAINYLADQGMNAFSFLTFSLEGDDKNVYPYISDAEFMRMDVSKMAQWEVIFEHADRQGMFMHFKTQETENDQILDGGDLGNARKLYYRELIARFGHHLAMNWNIGEENTNTDEQRKAFADWFEAHDPYAHPVVVHTYIGDQSKVYEPLYGYPSYDGASIQTMFGDVFRDTLARVQESAAAGKRWVVTNDEQGNAQDGVVPDSVDAEHFDIRSEVLWGNIMAGGAGVEYYFGYAHEQSDLTAQDFRSRANMWTQSKYALEFFSKFDVPFQNMSNRNDVVLEPNRCLAERGNSPGVFAVYIPSGGSAVIDLSGASGSSLSVQWYNPRHGGELQVGTVSGVSALSDQSLGNAPGNLEGDWVVLVTVD